MPAPRQVLTQEDRQVVLHLGSIRPIDPPPVRHLSFLIFQQPDQISNRPLPIRDARGHWRGGSCRPMFAVEIVVEVGQGNRVDCIDTGI